MYSIVMFKKAGRPVGVPSSWLIKEENNVMCYWPNKDQTSLIRRGNEPDMGWGLVACKILSIAKNFVEMTRKKLALKLTVEEKSDTEDNIIDDINTGKDDETELPFMPSKKRKISITPLRSSPNNLKENLKTNKIITPCALTNIIEMISETNKKIEKLEKKIDMYIAADKVMHDEVVDTKEEIKLIKDIIKNSSSIPVLEPTNLPPLPIKSAEELKILEETLNDDCKVKMLIRKLSNYGGANLRGTVNNIMKHAITSNVAVEYTLQGKRGKKSFLELMLCTCIQEAVRASSFGLTSDLVGINKYIAIQLTNAKDRLSNRKKQEQTEEQNEE